MQDEVDIERRRLQLVQNWILAIVMLQRQAHPAAITSGI